MDNEEVNDEQNFTYEPTGVPLALAIFLLAGLIIFAGGCVYFAQKTNPELSDKGLPAAQAAANKAQAELSIASVNRDLALRVKVIEQCVAKGNIPIFVGGNVDCKQAPK